MNLGITWPTNTIDIQTHVQIRTHEQQNKNNRYAQKIQVLTATPVTNNIQSTLHTFNTPTLSLRCKYFIFAGHEVCVIHVSHRIMEIAGDHTWSSIWIPINNISSLMEMSPSYRWHDTMKTPSGGPMSDDAWTWVVAAGSKACLSLGREVSSHMGAGVLVGHGRRLASVLKESMRHGNAAQQHCWRKVCCLGNIV